MSKNNWKMVYPDKFDKLAKYIPEENIKGRIFIRIYEKSTPMAFVQCLQISGDDAGFYSFNIKTDDMEEQIKKDFPFIQTFSVFSL